MADKKKQPRYTTPAGTAAFPRLETPNTKWNADGEYEVVLILDANETAPFIKKLEGMHTAAFEQAKKDNPKVKVKLADSPIKPALDSDKNEIEGKVAIRFRMKAKIKSRKTQQEWTQKPDIFDAKLKPLKGAKIGGGSIIKVSFETSPYLSNKDKTAGISLRLKAVQVLTLVEWQGGRDAASYGFAEEEDYAQEEAPDRSAEEEASAGTTDGDGSEEF